MRQNQAAHISHHLMTHRCITSTDSLADIPRVHAFNTHIHAVILSIDQRTGDADTNTDMNTIALTVCTVHGTRHDVRTARMPWPAHS
mmetsp:Transcript_25118/g.62187  ORF Transcript_25118/g.62187 Transcript_25118/m.62187 type:complete len:87 (-) Transcript_25118:1447-1707(-)